MKIGLVVDGESEYAALRLLFPRVRPKSSHTLIDPLMAKIPPLAPFPTIARACSARLAMLEQKGVDRIIVMMDQETRPGCSGEIAAALQMELARFCDSEVAVVLKARMFENWLVADLEALNAHPARFRVSSRGRQSIESNKADNIDALKFLKACSIKNEYDKVADAIRICKVASPDAMASHSRSFRRLLRLLGHRDYLDQSRLPVRADGR